MSWTTRHPEGG